MYNLLDKSYNGVTGVEIIDSGKEGPTIGISVCTHGGEVVGMEILEYLRNEQILDNIVRGRVFLILSNIQAYKKYLSLLENGQELSEKELLSTRFIDENMNRCCGIENLSNSNSYEVKRILELQPILEQLDVIFDIHSTYSPSDSMTILTNRSHEKYSDTFNVKKELVGITEVQVGKPFIDLVERRGGIGIGIESGCQLDSSGYKIGLENVIRLLQHLEMITDIPQINQHLTPKTEKQTLRISGSIVVKRNDFKFFKDYSHLDKIKKGEKICYDGERDIYADRDFLIIMPSKNNSDFGKLVGEEGCFLGEII